MKKNKNSIFFTIFNSFLSLGIKSFSILVKPKLSLCDALFTPGMSNVFCFRLEIAGVGLVDRVFQIFVRLRYDAVNVSVVFQTIVQEYWSIALHRKSFS
jgi:hypothetical protein